MARVWGIHCKYDRDLPLRENVIAIGWSEMGDISALPAEREAFKERHRQAYPQANARSNGIASGIVWSFAHGAALGDIVVYLTTDDRMVNLFEITGGCRYNAARKPLPGDYANERPVRLLARLPRERFSQGALYELAIPKSFFEIKKHASEFLSALSDGTFAREPLVSAEATTQAQIPRHIHSGSGSAESSADLPQDAPDSAFSEPSMGYDGIVELTKDYVLGTIREAYKGYPLEMLVSNLLEAMGYRTSVSRQGGDRGIDIIAYKDELPPRVVVQVKSGDGDVAETTVQSLRGAMREGDYGLFVTLSNYTPNARRYLDTNPIIRGINGSEFADLFLKYYDGLAEEYRSVVPLRQAWVPNPDEN